MNNENGELIISTEQVNYFLRESQDRLSCTVCFFPKVEKSYSFFHHSEKGKARSIAIDAVKNSIKNQLQVIDSDANNKNHGAPQEKQT